MTFESALVQLAKKSKLTLEELPIKSHGGGKISTLGAIMSLVTTMVGAGVLGFPKTFSNAGWYASPVLLLLCAWVAMEIGHILSDCLAMVEERLAEGARFSFTKPEKYEDICEAAFGSTGKFTATIMVNAFLLFMSGAFMILIGQSLEFVIQKAFFSPYRACVLAVSILFLPLTLLDDMSQIAKLSGIGVLASFVYVLAIGFAGFEAGMSDTIKDYNLYPAKLTDLGGVISVMFLGLTYQQVLPTVRSEMEAPRESSKAVTIAVAGVTLVYGTAGGLGFFGWGNQVKGNVLQSMVNEDGSPTVQGLMLSIAVIANLFVTFPIVMSIVSRAMEANLVGGLYSYTVRVCLFMVSLLIGLFVPFFLDFLTLIGAVLGVVVGGFMPVAVYWAMAGTKQYSVFQVVRHGGIILIGLVALIFGTLTSVQGLMASFERGKGGFWEYTS